MAAEWLGISEDEVTNDQRERAKSIMYGMLYGRGGLEFVRIQSFVHLCIFVLGSSDCSL